MTTIKFGTDGWRAAIAEDYTFHNVRRCARGVAEHLQRTGAAGRGVVVCHDRRFASEHFARACVEVLAAHDIRSFTPPDAVPTQVGSFFTRELGAGAGIVITASHNPPHDNGYKVYFDDGAQVVEPHASGIIAEVNGIKTERPASRPEGLRGEVSILGREIDEAYMKRLESLILDRDVVRSASSLRIVFTPLHGTGGVIIKPMLERLGFNFRIVDEQDGFDGNFPTVASPNPENAAALRLGVEMAEKEGADLVIATDPDCDRMGVAVRTATGTMELLTGNQIGSLLAYYRVKTLFDLGVLNKKNASHAVIIKTFVTTDLQKAIAEHYGLRCVETLTGFKYIGAKLRKYEDALLAALGKNAAGGGASRPYQEMSEEETRGLRLEHSSYYVFGGEESYGYSGGDFVRDKDGNGAAIMFCEVAAYAKSRGLSIDALLDEIYSEFGYFQEFTGSLTFEGAEGAATIKALLASYLSRSPNEMLGAQLIRVKNFETDTYRDMDGEEIPKEKMLMFEFGDHTRIAVRASGTEPKIKYYLFAQRRPQKGKPTVVELAAIKREVSEHLKRAWEWLRQDAATRVGP